MSKTIKEAIANYESEAVKWTDKEENRIKKELIESIETRGCYSIKDNHEYPIIKHILRKENITDYKYDGNWRIFDFRKE